MGITKWISHLEKWSLQLLKEKYRFDKYGFLNWFNQPQLEITQNTN